MRVKSRSTIRNIHVRSVFIPHVSFGSDATYVNSERQIWYNMKERCYNSRCKQYKYYGALGVKVCERWLSFPNFLADMGPRPHPKLTIDRINTFGNYEPGNCRWATHQEQADNQRKSSKRTFKENILTVQNQILIEPIDLSLAELLIQPELPVPTSLPSILTPFHEYVLLDKRAEESLERKWRRYRIKQIIYTKREPYYIYYYIKYGITVDETLF